MTDFKDMEQFARYVRKEAAYLMAALCEDLGADHPTTLRALQLVTTAADVAREQKEGYGVEVAAGEYDLAALGYDPYVPDDEGPFAGE